MDVAAGRDPAPLGGRATASRARVHAARRSRALGRWAIPARPGSVGARSVAHRYLPQRRPAACRHWWGRSSRLLDGGGWRTGLYPDDCARDMRRGGKPWHARPCGVPLELACCHSRDQPLAPEPGTPPFYRKQAWTEPWDDQIGSAARAWLQARCISGPGGRRINGARQDRLTYIAGDPGPRH